MSESSPAPPALPPASLSILALLVPFHPPLAPNILSTPLNTRHTFLPPSTTEPDSYLTSTTTYAHQSQSQADDGENVAYAKRNPVSARLEQLATSTARDDLHFGQVSYWRPDETTFVARARIVGFEDGSEASEAAVEVEWLWEGERDMGGRGWTLHAVDLSQSLSRQSEWRSDPQEAWDALLQPSRGEDAERESDAEDSNAGNDFWSSYSNSPTPATADSLSREESAQYTPHGDEDSSYWAAYGSVDDGLAGTQPTTPILKNNMSFTQLKGHSWGTGGETPIGWSPQEPVTPALHSLQSSPQIQTTTFGQPESVGGLLLQEQPSVDSEETHAAGSVDLSSRTASPVEEAPNAQLVKILSGTWELWKGSLGAGNDEASRKAFRAAVDEVLKSS